MFLCKYNCLEFLYKDEFFDIAKFPFKSGFVKIFNLSKPITLRVKQFFAFLDDSDLKLKSILGELAE